MAPQNVLESTIIAEPPQKQEIPEETSPKKPVSESELTQAPKVAEETPQKKQAKQALSIKEKPLPGSTNDQVQQATVTAVITQEAIIREVQQLQQLEAITQAAARKTEALAEKKTEGAELQLPPDTSRQEEAQGILDREKAALEKSLREAAEEANKKALENAAKGIILPENIREQLSSWINQLHTVQFAIYRLETRRTQLLALEPLSTEGTAWHGWQRQMLQAETSRENLIRQRNQLLQDGQKAIDAAKQIQGHEQDSVYKAAQQAQIEGIIQREIEVWDKLTQQNQAAMHNAFNAHDAEGHPVPPTQQQIDQLTHNMDDLNERAKGIQRIVTQAEQEQVNIGPGQKEKVGKMIQPQSAEDLQNLFDLSQSVAQQEKDIRGQIQAGNNEAATNMLPQFTNDARNYQVSLLEFNMKDAARDSSDRYATIEESMKNPSTEQQPSAQAQTGAPQAETAAEPQAEATSASTGAKL